MTVSSPSTPGAGASPRGSLEDLLPALVRRIAWSGDGRRGTVRLEIGEGALRGAVVVLTADAGSVTLRVAVPPGTDAGALESRLARRFDGRVDVVVE